MAFIETAKKRYSVRTYKNTPVEKEKIIQVLEAGRMAPSACNLQPWHFVVITDEALKAKVAEAYPRDWFKNAPVIIAVCGDHSQSWKRVDGKDHCNIDAAIAAEHLSLAAADLGLGTCWVCAFDAQKCHKALGLPDNQEVIVLLPLGYPASESSAPEKQRKGLDEIATWR